MVIIVFFLGYVDVLVYTYLGSSFFRVCYRVSFLSLYFSRLFYRFSRLVVLWMVLYMIRLVDFLVMGLLRYFFCCEEGWILFCV